jgi:AcrR family transcriptional regulator
MNSGKVPRRREGSRSDLRPRGRRGGPKGVTRTAIVVAAGRLFARHGYEGVSLREIARQAGVDAGMIYHYFGGKEELFLESLRLTFQPLRPSGPPGGAEGEDLGERIVKRFLDTWDVDGKGNPFLGVLRACATSDSAAAALRKFASEAVVPAVRQDIGEDVGVRTALVGSQLLGLATVRYLLRFEPLASMNHTQLARRVGPLLTATLLSGSPRTTERVGEPD